MKNGIFRWSIGSVGVLASLGLMAQVSVLRGAEPGATAAAGQASVRVVKKDNGFQLLRNGQPYFIKGAGGSASLKLLRDSGGN